MVNELSPGRLKAVCFGKTKISSISSIKGDKKVSIVE